MKLSVVIPAFNHPDDLANSLSTLRNQTVPPHEIIVVDDGSKTPIEAQPGVIVTRLEREPLYRGSSAAKNAGAALATGNWLAFSDDDILHMPDAVESVARKVASIGRDDILINVFSLGVPDGILDIIDWKRGDSASMEALLTRFRQQNKLYAADEGVEDAVKAARNAGPIAGLVYDVEKALMVSSEQHFGVISRRFFNEIGGYDAEAFKAWGLNNQDLCLRVMKAGGWIYSDVLRADGEVLHCFHSRVTDHDSSEAKADFMVKYGQRYSPLMLIEAGRTCITRKSA